MRRFIFVAVFFLAACVDRTLAPVMPGALAVGTIHPVFVATTRAKEADGSFGRNRTLDMQYLETKVSVPPQHKRGQIKHQFGNPDPETDFVIASQDSFAGSAEFRRELKGQITAQPAQERDVILYVHGYYNSYSDGVFRAAQLKHDLDLPGTVVHFSWPSAATPLAYTYDRDSMLFSRDALEQLLNDIRASGARRIILMGHSLGTMLIMETLRQIEIKQPGWSARSLGGVILISPDIDVDLFKSQMHRFASLPKPFAIFVSQKDRALQLSARVNGSANRLGTVTDPAELADYEVTLIDVSEFSSNREVGHFTVGTSPALIAILNRSTELDSAFQRDRAGRTGLLQGTVITVQNATQLILSPGLVVQN